MKEPDGKVIIQSRGTYDPGRRARDTAALRSDFIWWSFYWPGPGTLTAVYLGVGPERTITGNTADEVRTKIERTELGRREELARLREDFPGLTIWCSESGRIYAISPGPQHAAPLTPVREADTASELRRLIAGGAK